MDAEANQVSVRVCTTGNHTGGPLFGVPASGRAICGRSYHLARFDSRGFIVQHWFDDAIRLFGAEATARVA